MADTASHSAVDDFTTLDLASSALLLDVDGTLIDIGPSPFEVHVPEALCRSLERLLKRMDGALALVSGRPIRDIDKLFSPLKLPAVGGHGAEMRLAGGEVITRAKALPGKLRMRLALAATPGSGVVLEDKGYSFALHYRQTPQQEPRLRALVDRVRAEFPDEALEVLLGKAMFEVKRPGISKGEAVRSFDDTCAVCRTDAGFYRRRCHRRISIHFAARHTWQGLFGRTPFRGTCRDVRCARRSARSLAAACVRLMTLTPQFAQSI